MSVEHWFDTWNKASAVSGPRRVLFRAAATLVTGLVVDDASVTIAGRKHKGGGKGKKHKNKGHRNPTEKPEGSCSEGQCAGTWPGQPDETDYCELICRQCDGADSRQFCIRDGTKPDGTATKVADCCDEGEECCDGSCFRPTPGGEGACCDGKWTYLAFNHEHCGACGNRCAPDEVCENSQCYCPNCNRDCGLLQSVCRTDFHGCCPIGPDYECCSDGCKAVISDRFNCGTCGNVCPPAQTCHGGECGCHDPQRTKYCDTAATCQGCESCIPEANSCCGFISGGCPTGIECCGSESTGGWFCSTTGTC
jgi:hypothetical protein